MRYVSTRDPSHAVPLSAAISRGLAPDGGLYVAQPFPTIDPLTFDADASLPDVAARLLAPFFAGDALESALGAICRESLSFPVP
ncbi:MAG TPA: hypothetical protein VEY93_16645, partial [Longimicrobium sp.]|nr:hypothetical protein [Longimicrobium sp.]